MSWVRFDDGFADHPKIARVGAFGAWLQMQALCYANKNLTDGFVPFGVARSFARRGVDYVDGKGCVWTLCETSGRQGRDLADVDWPMVMVDAEIWEPADGGYQIHDYEKYQPSRRQVERERRAARGRMRHLRSVNVRANFSRKTPEVPGTGTGSGDLFPSPDPESGARARVTFADFWALYPRREAKQDALRAWKKLKPDAALLDAIRAALAWQIALPGWQEGKIPHPATYLNGRRWEDEPPNGATPVSAEESAALDATVRDLLAR